MLRIEAGLIDSCTGPEPHGAVDGDSDSLSESETLAVIQLLHGLAGEGMLQPFPDSYYEDDGE